MSASPIQSGGIEASIVVPESTSEPGSGAAHEGRRWCDHCGVAGNHYTADHPRPPIPRRKMGPSDLLGCTADGQLVTLTEWQAGAVEALLQGDPIREVFFGLGRGAGKTTVLATVERRLENERAGACGDPECHVLHSDPANPIHPPWYVRP